MKLKTFYIIVAGMVVAAVFFSRHLVNKATEQRQRKIESIEKKLQTVSGIPLSVCRSIGEGGMGGLMTVIDNDGKKIYAESKNFNNNVKIREAYSMINSEISDGDAQPIELQGDYDKNGIFTIRTVKVEKQNIDIDPYDGIN